MVNINALYLPCWTARLWEKKGVKDPAASCLAFGVQFFPFREYPGPHLGDLMKWEFWTELSIQMETRKWIIKQPGVPLPFGFTSNENNLDKKNEHNMFILSNSCRQKLHYGTGRLLESVIPESTYGDVCECVHVCTCAKLGKGDWEKGTECGWNLTISFSSPSLSKACWPFSRWSPMETHSAPAPRPLLAAASRTNSRATSRSLNERVNDPPG